MLLAELSVSFVSFVHVRGTSGTPSPTKNRNARHKSRRGEFSSVDSVKSQNDCHRQYAPTAREMFIKSRGYPFHFFAVRYGIVVYVMFDKTTAARLLYYFSTALNIIESRCHNKLSVMLRR